MSLPFIVEADSVHFNGSTQILTGKHVYLKKKMDDNSLLNMKSENLNVNKNLRTLQSEGWTEITYKNMISNQEHQLICEGSLFVDHQKKQVFIEGSSIKQIIFVDNRGTIHSDRAVIDYEEKNNHYLPKKISLMGNVHMHNNIAKTGSSDQPIEQYALADRVEYLPEQEFLTLQADPKKRVLFFDKINHMQMSAPEIIITRNPKTKKESIKGQGDVRLTFAGQELEQLYKEFHIKK